MLCAVFLGVGLAHGQDRGLRADLVWPNASSRVNSDPWLVANHDRIRVMRPRVVVLNFCNGLPEQEVRAKADAVIALMRESSRYHGYRDPKAAAFLEDEIAKFVELADPAKGTVTRDGNSSRYPRVPGSKQGHNFQHSRLFTAEFAAYYGINAPGTSSAPLNLKQLVDQAFVHEMRFFVCHR